jgi:transposase
MSESGALDSFWKDRVMAKPYSDDLRVRAIAIVEGGASRHEVAALLEVSPSSVINWLRRWSDDGSSAAKPSGGSVSPLEKHAGWLLALIAEHPDLTLDEAVTAMRRRRIVGSRSALSRFFIRHDITFKKKACGPRSRLGQTSPAREDAGFESKARLTLRDWCLSTRPPPAPRWCGSTVDVHGAFD